MSNLDIEFNWLIVRSNYADIGFRTEVFVGTLTSMEEHIAGEDIPLAIIRKEL